MTTMRSLVGPLDDVFSVDKFLRRWSFAFTLLMCCWARPLVTTLRAAGEGARDTALAGVDRRGGAPALLVGLAFDAVSSALTNCSLRMLCHPRTPPCLAIWAKSLWEYDLRAAGVINGLALRVSRAATYRKSCRQD